MQRWTVRAACLLLANLVAAALGQESDDLFYRSGNGVTVLCPDADVGDTGIVDGMEYTKRSEDDVRALVGGGPTRLPLLASTCTSGVTNMSGLFYFERYGLDISDSPLTTFNEDISTWDTSSVVDMSYMFAFAFAFDQPLGSWDTSQVRDMGYTFAYAKAFDQPIGSWNMSSVSVMGFMFAFARSFNGPIGDWSVEAVKDMSHMFVGANMFDQALEGWDVSNASDMSYMFSDARSFNQPLGDWNTSSVTTMKRMFSNARTFNQNLSGWCVASVEDFTWFSAGSSMETGYEPAFGTDAGCRTNKNLRTELFYLGNNNVTILCPDAEIGDTGTVNGKEYTKRSEDELRALIRGGPSQFPLLASTCTSGIADMNGLFNSENYEFAMDKSELIMFNEDISGWDTSSVVDMSYMFVDAAAFNRSIGNWDTRNVTNMAAMFENSAVFNQPIGDWITSNVIDMSYMLADAVAFDQPIGTWDTSNVIDMSFILYNAKSFNHSISDWDTSNVVDMSLMLFNASAFNNDLSYWNVGGVLSCEFAAVGSNLLDAKNLPKFTNCNPS